MGSGERAVQQLRVPLGLQVPERLRKANVPTHAVQLVRPGLLLQEDRLAVVGVASPGARHILLPPRVLLPRLCDPSRWGPHGRQEEEEEKVESGGGDSDSSWSSDEYVVKPAVY